MIDDKNNEAGPLCNRTSPVYTKANNDTQIFYLIKD